MSNSKLNLAQRARKALGLSQNQMAELLGISQSQIGRWEGGQAMTAATRALMQVMVAHPDVVLETLEKR
jgi:transcriptional regulator with XRE-family HTH domain